MNGSHMEPEHPPPDGGRNDAFNAHFLGCHVMDLQSSCDLVYNGTMCQQHEYKDCIVIKA